MILATRSEDRSLADISGEGPLRDGQHSDAQLTGRAGTPPNFPDYVDRGPFRFFSSLAWDGRNGDMRRAGPWIEVAEAPFGLQARGIYDRMEEALSDCGGLAAVLRQHMYQRDKRRFPVLEAIRQERELDGVAPSSGLGLTSLRDDEVNYEIDAIALSPQGATRLGPRTVLDSPGVGEAAALYSQAVAAGPYIFTAGMLALAPDKSWAVTSFDDIAEEGRWLQRGRSHPDHRTGPVISQTWTLYERFDAFLRELGLELSQVANATVFIHDEGDFADALRVHEHWFASEGPALQVIPVDEVGHKGSVIEIEITATRGSLRRMPGPSGAPPSVVQADGLIFVSDHLPITGDGRILWIDDASAYFRREAALARIAADLDPEQQLLATQMWVALKNLLGSLDEFGIEGEALGQVTVRLLNHSRSGVPWLVDMFRSVLGDVDRAVVLLAVPWIPQSKYARVSVSGVGFSDV